MRNKKIYLVIALIGVMSLIFGVTYAFFSYNKTGSNNKIIAGDISMSFTDNNDSINLVGVFPETKEEARSRDDNYVTFTIEGTNSSNKTIYYEIDLIHGDDETGLTRFNDKDLRFDLVEVVDGVDTIINENVSFDEINNSKIWVDTVDNGTSNYFKTYKLRMWLDEDVLISDTNPNASYLASTYKNHYASIKVKVVGDFDEKEMPKICKRATLLHTEVCDRSGSSDGCGGKYQRGDTVTYGRLGSGNLTTGDAFDCDVNGDGEYNSETERFYYLTEMNNNTAVLIYYNNVSGGLPDNMSAYAYNTNYSNTNYFGPQTAILQLPTTSQWKNVSLTNTTRDIKDELGTTRISGFSYSDYAARLLTYEEVQNGCYDGTKSIESTSGLSTKCKFLIENTTYSSSSLRTVGPWLETPRSSGAYAAWFVVGGSRSVYSYYVNDTGGRGVRPAIEVLKSNIEI